MILSAWIEGQMPLLTNYPPLRIFFGPLTAAMIATLGGCETTHQSPAVTGSGGRAIEKSAAIELRDQARKARSNKDLEAAVRLYRQALTSAVAADGVAATLVRVELGETLLDAGDLEDSLLAINQSLEEDRRRPQADKAVLELANIALGRIHIRARRPTEAIGFFERALEANSASMRALTGRGIALAGR
jgi:Flp pilus assembly protein TadD